MRAAKEEITVIVGRRACLREPRAAQDRPLLSSAVGLRRRFVLVPGRVFIRLANHPIGLDCGTDAAYAELMQTKGNKQQE